MKKRYKYIGKTFWRTWKILILMVLLMLSNSLVEAEAQITKPSMADARVTDMEWQISGSELSKIKVSLNYDQVPIKKLLTYIEQKKDVQFSYNMELLADNPKVTVSLKNVGLDKALDEIFKNTVIDYYSFQDGYIVLQENKNKKDLVIATITGTVTDGESGETLPGVNVIVKGTTTGTSTGAEGTYELNAPSLQDTLVFSFVGYQRQEVSINGRTEIDVSMQPQAISGEEMVVVAYGTQSTRNMTGSVQNVSTEDFQDSPTSQFAEKLQGRLSGVKIQQNTGKPGEGISIKIRGSASITAGSDPLFVVDGMPIVGGINDISSDQIESISVLKDAAATSLYGSRAANGVVLIETKKAVVGETKVNFKANYGIQKIPQYQIPDMMNAREYAQFQKEIDELNGRAVDPEFENPETYGKGTDWYDAITRSAPIQDYNLSLSSGSEKFSTMANLGYSNQEGVVVNTGYERYSLRINSSFQPNKNLDIGLNIAPSRSINTNKNTDGEFQIINGALLTTPLAPLKNDNGSLTYTASDPATFGNPNWLRTAKERVNETKSNRILSNAYLNYELIEGLNLKTSVGIDLGESKNFYFNPSTTGGLFSPPPNTPNGGESNSNYQSWTNENTLKYQAQVRDHKFDALIGLTAQSYRSEFSSITGDDYPDDKIQDISAAGRTNTSSGIQEWALFSYLASVNYMFKDRYLLSASIRRDGSSRFGIDNRWGNFPSISASWIISEESFMKNINSISFLKLRASYGMVGNFSIGNYTHIPTINSSNYVFNNSLASGRSTTNLGDSRLGWEENKEYNFGVNVNLFDDRIRLTYDYYQKKTSNLLYNIAIPRASGFSNLQTNIGELKFWGHEISINSRNIERNDFNWNTTFNISFNRNEVLALGTQNASLFDGPGGLLNRLTVTKVGHQIGMFYGWIHDGVYDDQEEFNNSPKHVTSQVGTVKFKDINGDGVINVEDQTIMGNPNPDFIFGFTNDIRIKNFDLSFVVSGSYGNEVFNSRDRFLGNLDGVFNVLKDLENRWKSPENPGDGTWGSVQQGTTALERNQPNSRMLYDGSYIAINNITLGYTIPLNNNRILSRARFYGSIQNALMFSSYPGHPEVNTANNQGSTNTLMGVDDTSYPIPRYFTLGINLGF